MLFLLIYPDIECVNNYYTTIDKDSKIRVGTAAITTRGLVEEDMETIVALIDKVLSDHTNEAIIEAVADEVNEMMSERAIFVF